MRLDDLKNWLQTIDSVADGDVTVASDDASFRRYFRVQKSTQSFIVMDAPPDKEDALPFVRIAGYLEAMQLNSPRVLEADLDQGFLLLTDLGNRQYLAALDEQPADADELYADAIDALLAMQSRGGAYQSRLPPYGEQLLRFELSLFHDWLCGTHLGIRFDDESEGAWQQICDLLVANALDQPQVFVHRDYHSRNLMVTQEQNPGILDFQDAVEGPLTYDLVSLLKDCYVKWPAERVRDWALGFFESSGEDLPSGIDSGQFLRYFELMGVQRHLKAAGIFARLNHRDGKTGYMNDIPRTLGYITDLGSRYAELRFLVNLVEEQVSPGLEAES